MRSGHVSSLVSVVLFLAMLSSGCRSSKENEASSPASTSLLLTSFVVEWLLDKVIEVPVQRKIEQVFDTLAQDEQGMGGAESTLAKAIARNLKTSLDQSFQRDIEIKLNALQVSLQSDYIPDLPESPIQLSLMGEKANEIVSALESYAADAKDIPRSGMALANYHSYILASTIKLYVQSERLRMAKKALGGGDARLLDLKKSIQTLAQKSREHVHSLETRVLSTFARATFLSYEYRESAASESFGFKQGVRYAYCVKKPQGPALCGPSSALTCSNQLDAACIRAAKDAARDAFTAAQVDQELLYRSRLSLRKIM